MNITYRLYDLPLAEVFTIARGSTSSQPSLIVQLSEAGHYGYGEATTNRFYGQTAERITSALDRVRSLLGSASAGDLDHNLARLGEALADEPFALSAVDQALHDLCGKVRGQTVHEMWGVAREGMPLSDYTIGIDTTEKMTKKLLAMPDWPIYKIKLGSDRDLEIVRALREHTDAVFRVDANCGWTASQTVDYSHELAELGVEFIEQPMPPEDRDGAHLAFERSCLPLIADESCVSEQDVARCAGLFHGVNIKLVKCGGLAPARRMIAEANELGLQVMAGCMTESSVGISALAQLLPLLDCVDLDGAVLLAEDIAKGVIVERGECHFPDRNGTGVELLDGPLSSE